MKTAYCLDCNQSIQVDDNYQVGNVVECSNCESEFEVNKVTPLEITWHYNDDWDDDEWDSDDDDDNWEEEEEEEEDIENWSWMLAKRKRIDTMSNHSHTKHASDKRDDGPPKRKVSYHRERIDFSMQ